MVVARTSAWSMRCACVGVPCSVRTARRVNSRRGWIYQQKSELLLDEVVDWWENVRR